MAAAAAEDEDVVVVPDGGLAVDKPAIGSAFDEGHKPFAGFLLDAHVDVSALADDEAAGW